MLVISNEIFDNYSFTDRDIDVFIDITEKILGAKSQSLDFIRQLINAPSASAGSKED